MMHDHQANAVGVCEGLEPGNDLIIISVAVIVPAHFPDLLESVYDDQRGIRVLPKETGKLFIQAFAELLGCNREEQLFIFCCTKHPVQAFLQASVVIFQGKVEHCALPHREAPERRSRTDVVSDLSHEEALAHLRSSDKEIHSTIEQAVYNGRPALKNVVKELCHGDYFEIGRVCHPQQFPL